MRISVSCVVNGAPVGAEVEPRTLLVDFLRNQLHLTGTHVGCDTSQCGACVVHVDGRAIKSCSMLAAQAEGAEITTIEGLAAKSGAIGRTDLHPMQAAFRAEHGLQCGFCTAGHDHDRGRTRDPRSEPERSGRARWAGGQLLPLYGLSQHREGSSQGGGPTCVRPAAARGEAAPAGAESSHV